jgi:hypothetical protein
VASNEDRKEKTMDKPRIPESGKRGWGQGVALLFLVGIIALAFIVALSGRG